MNMKKIVAVASALALTAAVAVGGTLAFLQSETKSLSNQFTYVAAAQNVTLDLYEHKLNADGKTLNMGEKLYASTLNGETAQTYTIIPGATVAKDPTLELKSGDTCVYVYAEVCTTGTDGAIADITMDSNWTSLGKHGIHGGELYILTTSMDGTYKTQVEGTGQDATAKTADLPVFTNVTYGALSNANASAEIAVYGYAVDVNAKGASDTHLKVYTDNFKLPTAEPGQD